MMFILRYAGPEALPFLQTEARFSALAIPLIRQPRQADQEMF
jgi:hypothetical protein